MMRRRGRPAGRAGLFCAAGLILGLLPAHAAPLPVTLSDPLSGSPVEVRAGAPLLHVVFFATWCPACVEELDPLADLWARWEQSGYRLVIVAVATRQSPERLARFAAERQPPGQFLHDPDGRVAKAFGAENLPAHFLIDASGAVVATADSLDQTFRKTLEDFLRRSARDGERGE